MMAKYRVVHFVPDPFSGARIPVAALVASGTGVSFTPAARIPSAACLGGTSSFAALQLVLESLRLGLDTFDSLPVATGPHAVLGAERMIPGNISDPVAWVKEHVLPQEISARQNRESTNPRRDYQGYRFFETWRVSQYVRKRFSPDLEWSHFSAVNPRLLSPVSHWVGKPATGLLLMEPIILSRPDHGNEIRQVFNQFAGYRKFLEDHSIPGEAREKTKLLVYVLPGGKPQERKSALLDFTNFDVKAVDTESESQRGSFIEDIRNLGQAAKGQVEVPGTAN